MPCSCSVGLVVFSYCCLFHLTRLSLLNHVVFINTVLQLPTTQGLVVGWESPNYCSPESRLDSINSKFLSRPPAPCSKCNHLELCRRDITRDIHHMIKRTDICRLELHCVNWGPGVRNVKQPVPKFMSANIPFHCVLNGMGGDISRFYLF